MSCFAALRPSPPASPTLCPSASCMSLLHRVSFRPRRRRLACGASLFRAYRMGARARLSCRRAYRAPDCARETPAQGARLPSVPLGFFSHRCEAGGEAASGCRFLLTHLTTVLQGSSPYRELFHNSRTNCCLQEETPGHVMRCHVAPTLPLNSSLPRFPPYQARAEPGDAMDECECPRAEPPMPGPAIEPETRACGKPSTWVPCRERRYNPFAFRDFPGLEATKFNPLVIVPQPVRFNVPSVVLAVGSCRSIWT